MINDVKTLLKSLPFTSSLSEDEITQLLHFAQHVVFVAGHTIIHQGKKSPGLYLILSGSALVTTKILGEGGTYITTLGAGNIIGEVTLIERGPCPTSIMASNQINSLLITNEYFDALTIVNPPMKYKIIRQVTAEIINRLQDMRNKIKNFIITSPMTSQSMFSTLVKTFNQPTEIPLGEEYIRQVKFANLFKNFSKVEIQELLKHAILLKAAKNANLINEGDTQQALFILLRGAVQTNVIEHKKMAKLSVLGPTSIMCGIQIIKSHTSAILQYNTCEQAVFLKIGEEKIHQLKENNAELWFKLFELICKAFVALERAADKLDVRLNSEIYNR